MSGRARLQESRDEQRDHAAGIVVRVVVRTNAEVADAVHAGHAHALSFGEEWVICGNNDTMGPTGDRA